jgi:hypothetical protein
VYVTPFLLTLDVVNNAIDLNGFVEYLKTVQKKEVTIVNAQDFAEAPHKTPATKSKHHSKRISDSSPAIAQGIKNQIDSCHINNQLRLFVCRIEKESRLQ